MAVTQKDIARKMGLSPSLVSRVLSGRAREVAISEKTIEEVTRLAEEMGYVPNIAAQSLKGIPSRTIGVMVGHFSSFFFGKLVDTILREAKRQGYSVVLVGFDAEQEQTDEDLGSLLKHPLDGIIVIGSSRHTNWMNSLGNRKVPVIHVGHGLQNEPSTRISIDEDQAIKLLLEHLKEQNCQNIAFLGFVSFVSEVRRAAVEKYAKKLKLNIVENGIITAEEDDQQTIADAAENVMQFSTRPDAVVCASDVLALGLIHELAAHGLSVPGDIAISGINDFPYAHLFNPRLTTIKQPVKKLIDLAFDALKQNAAPQEIKIAPELVIRESSLHGRSTASV